MAKDGNGGNSFPQGTCPDSDHIAQERARLSSAAQRHFAQTMRQPAASPKQKQATGGNGMPQLKAVAPTDLPKTNRVMTQLGLETIGALKGSPLLLVVVVLNVGMIFALLYVANAQKDERQILTKMLVESCGKAGP